MTAAVIPSGNIEAKGSLYSVSVSPIASAAAPSWTASCRTVRYSGMNALSTTTSLLPVPDRPTTSQVPSMIS
ncbi:hypothetical protein ABT075_16135 [Streptomyces sp. NPDC002677]|uniref:hypothetical protein n=1 Tax=Streptomyces sp. NPDC002677 TaxID=3154774 RepID=UPI00331F9A0C